MLTLASSPSCSNASSAATYSAVIAAASSSRWTSSPSTSTVASFPSAFSRATVWRASSSVRAGDVPGRELAHHPLRDGREQRDDGAVEQGHGAGSLTLLHEALAGCARRARPPRGRARASRRGARSPARRSRRSAAPASARPPSARPRCSASASRTARAAPPAPTPPAARRTRADRGGDPPGHRRTGSRRNRHLPCSEVTEAGSGRSPRRRRRAPRPPRSRPSSRLRTATPA